MKRLSSASASLALLLGIATMAQTVGKLVNGVSHFKNVNADGAAETDPNAISSTGAIAGDFVDRNGMQHGMILSGKKLTQVDRSACVTTPGSGLSFYGINLKGRVAGWCANAKTGENDAFTYFNGKFVPILPPESVSTQARAINDKNQVVGSYLDSSKTQHGFLFRGGKYITLDVPDESNTDAWGINNKGMITLFAVNSGGTYDSFLFDGKTYTNINVPNEANSFVASINLYGDRIYTVLDSSNNMHGAFFLNGKKGAYFVFDDPKGPNTTSAFGLNDKLHIVGRYVPGGSRAGNTTQGYSAVGCCRGFAAPHAGSH